MSGHVAITVGHFDGAHQGHCRLVGAARDAVGPNGRVVVLSFDPSPLSILHPASAPARLTHLRQRSEWLIRAGATEVLPLVPTREMLDESAETFLRRIVSQFNVGVIVEGQDFRFGRKRQGSVQTLGQFESELGYRTIIIDPVETTLDDHSVVRVSSTMIRWMIRHGRVADAAHMLGRPYELIGDVVSGDKRGRTIGFPTSNLNCGDQLLPANGVYAGRAHHPDGNTYAAAISVGTKPTFQESDAICEAYLLDYDGPVDDYHWSMRLEFHAWIRGQVAFPGVDPLLEQMDRDVERTRRVLAVNAPTWRSPVEFHGG